MLRVALTPGEPAGIGPDLCIQMAQREHGCELIVIADPVVLEQRAQQIGLPLKLKDFDPQRPRERQRKRELQIIPVSMSHPVACGQLNPANSAAVLKALDCAIDGCLRKDFDALVTGPMHKAVINDAGIPFSGHTEYLAARSASETVVMLLSTPMEDTPDHPLHVALVTTHLPLSQVSQTITATRLQDIIRTLNHSFKRHFSCQQPAILVCGLNPHAGEGGHLGHEEIEIIIPVLEQLRKEEIKLIGPIPADTAFTSQYLQQADVILAMYHDQGLAVLKHRGFGKAVNTTLGLPFIRTSVDHGTALTLAGSGHANSESLEAALQMALKLQKNRL
ncbi:MAG: 4-hydroxythreonine-4-phosphate dehydrogenase PdxA [Gammaproteobacteria bacterium]|nr:4-hydroxythreonine-4-phosphate dehydrogenase PdxA [Gammaproteobacteria bacterium]